jgi:hypothetical protein
MSDYDLMIICNLCQTEECLIKVENITWSSNLKVSIRLEERIYNDVMMINSILCVLWMFISKVVTNT